MDFLRYFEAIKEINQWIELRNTTQKTNKTVNHSKSNQLIWSFLRVHRKTVSAFRTKCGFQLIATHGYNSYLIDYTKSWINVIITSHRTIEWLERQTQLIIWSEVFILYHMRFLRGKILRRNCWEGYPRSSYDYFHFFQTQTTYFVLLIQFSGGSMRRKRIRLSFETSREQFIFGIRLRLTNIIKYLSFLMQCDSKWSLIPH